MTTTGAMTPELIDSLLPGWITNQLIAERCMGWASHMALPDGVVWSENGWYQQEGERRWVRRAGIAWSPTTHIADAWRLLEKMIERRYWFAISGYSEERNGVIDQMWVVKFGPHGQARSASLPMALCRAALLATM